MLLEVTIELTVKRTIRHDLRFHRLISHNLADELVLPLRHSLGMFLRCLSARLTLKEGDLSHFASHDVGCGFLSTIKSVVVHRHIDLLSFLHGCNCTSVLLNYLIIKNLAFFGSLLKLAELLLLECSVENAILAVMHLERVQRGWLTMMVKS